MNVKYSYYVISTLAPPTAEHIQTFHRFIMINNNNPNFKLLVL